MRSTPMQLNGLIFLGLLCAVLSSGDVIARGVEGNSWGSVLYSGVGTSVTLNASSNLAGITSNSASIDGTLSFAPGTSSTNYYVANNGENETEYCWDSCSEQVVVGVLAENPVDNQATEFSISFGYSASSCATTTASLTVDGTTYTAKNPCQLSENASLPLSSSPTSPDDTGALMFTVGSAGAVLVNSANYLNNPDNTAPCTIGPDHVSSFCTVPGPWVKTSVVTTASAPEIDPSSSGAALMLLVGTLLISRGRGADQMLSWLRMTILTHRRCACEGRSPSSVH